MSYKIILFDADGMTLVSKRFSDQIQQDHGISWQNMKSFFDGPFQRCKIGKADLKEELAKVIADWGWHDSVESLMRYWFSIGSDPHPEILSVAKELRSKGVRCYVATNQEKYRAAYLRSLPVLADAFDGFFVSSEIGHTKDDPRYFEAIYQYLTQSMGPIPKNAFLFTDHEAKNLAAATTFGFQTYSYHDPESFRAFVCEE